MTFSFYGKQYASPLKYIAHLNRADKKSDMARAIRPYAHDRASIVLSDNDYLGIAHDEELRKAFLEEVGTRYAFSSSASPLLMGASPAHSELEKRLKAMYGRPALLFPSGWHANTGLVKTLGQTLKENLFICPDRLSHASILDGTYFSTLWKAKFLRFEHNDVRQLREILERYKQADQAALVFIESVYSMDGDVGPIKEITELKNDFPNLLIAVDEAHAMGVFGNDGSGLAKQMGLLEKVDFLIGTFGKGLASTGAFIVCDPAWHQFLVNHARSLIYSTAEPEINAAWTLWVLKHMPEFEDRRQRLAAISAEVRKKVKALGFKGRQPTPVSLTHIVPVVFNSFDEAKLAWERMASLGIRTGLVRSPSVPLQTERLRLSLRSTLTDLEVEKILSALESLQGAAA